MRPYSDANNNLKNIIILVSVMCVCAIVSNDVIVY